MIADILSDRPMSLSGILIYSGRNRAHGQFRARARIDFVICSIKRSSTRGGPSIKSSSTLGDWPALLIALLTSLLRPLPYLKQVFWRLPKPLSFFGVKRYTISLFAGVLVGGCAFRPGRSSQIRDFMPAWKRTMRKSCPKATVSRLESYLRLILVINFHRMVRHIHMKRSEP